MPTVNGIQQVAYTYNAANQVTNPGWTYDAAGNLTSDGLTSYSYDALGRLTGTTAPGQTRGYVYNGDGTLISATANGTSTTYTQDLASSLSQVLATTSGISTTDYLRDDGGSLLASLTGGSRVWYSTDRQASVRQTVSDAGSVLGNLYYEPYGQPEGGVLASNCFMVLSLFQDTGPTLPPGVAEMSEARDSSLLVSPIPRYGTRSRDLGVVPAVRARREGHRTVSFRVLRPLHSLRLLPTIRIGGAGLA